MKAKWWRRLLVATLVWSPLTASAAGLAPRSVQVGSSAQSAVTSYVFNATTATAASIGSVKFEICTTATGACVLPLGVSTLGATLTAQSPAGFTVDSSTNGAPFITRAPALIGASVATSFTLSGITNPSATNTPFYARITTFTGIDGATGPVDTGTVALSTAQPVQLTGVTPEILAFCVGITIGANCTTVSGSSIDFGDFSPTATRSGTSVMQAQTNAANGYAITVTGTTLASGVNTIAALAAQGPSTIGTGQFGLNLRSNTVPVVGADPTGIGSGNFTGNYGLTDQYRFNNGDVVATAALPTDANTFTSSYIVNIGGSQAAGVYTATLTYICTASF
jgi:hypothetical protein